MCNRRVDSLSAVEMQQRCCCCASPRNSQRSLTNNDGNNSDHTIVMGRLFIAIAREQRRRISECTVVPLYSLA